MYKDIFSFECLKRDVHFCLFPPMNGFIYHSPGSKLVLIAKVFVACFGSWLCRPCSVYADNLYLRIMSSYCIEWKWTIQCNIPSGRIWTNCALLSLLLDTVMLIPKIFIWLLIIYIVELCPNTWFLFHLLVMTIIWYAKFFELHS